MATERGVIYYKLDSQYQYDGDITKNCGLTGGEIDGNFHFLRGYDIKSFDVSEDKAELIITRLNGEKMSINVHQELNGYDFSYDKKNGVLSVTSPNGEIFDLEGFITEKVFHVYGDSTISGDGTRYNPIKISSLAKTGTYSPAKNIIDIVEGGELPKHNIAKGERYVTKEEISKLGLLYPLSGIQEIQKRLEEIGSEWRVPTKEDWDQLLNIIEDCPQDKTHGEDGLTNTYLGANAGAYLKSVEYWEPIYRKLENGEIILSDERYSLDENGNYIENPNGEYVKELKSEDKYGFTIYPTGFGDRRGVSSISGFGKWAAFWSSTEEDKFQDMFVKVFSNKESGVEQNSWGRDCYLSLRLVKNYDGSNLFDTEDIDGNTVSTIYIEMEDEGDKDKYNKTLIWTKENISFTNPLYGGVKSEEWEAIQDNLSVIRYFINEWDGVKWVTTELKEGESVVLLECNGVEMHEWRLVKGEFIDTADIIRGELKSDMEMVKESLHNLTNITSELENEVKVLDEIQENHNKLTEFVSNVANVLDTELSDRESGDKFLENLIGTVKSDLIAEDNKLQKQIYENKVESYNDTIIVNNGSTNENGETSATQISVKLPTMGMIKFDENGLYFDGDFSFGGNIINN